MTEPTDHELYALAVRVGEHLGQSRRHLVTAESCTGGWIGKVATDVVGSSAWFSGGAIVYSNELKQRSVSVSEQTLTSRGAVSEAVVREMAAGALKNFGAEISIAVSGVAGPDGGTVDKPVGTVWFAWSRLSDSSVETIAEQKNFAGDRERVRRQTVAHALLRVLDF